METGKTGPKAANDFSHHKAERLKSRKLIGAIFRSGRSVGAFPLRAVFLPLLLADAPFPAQVSISVPKKRFKSAVERNLLRRRLREAWRLNAPDFYEKLAAADRRVAVMVIFVGQEAVEFSEMQKGVKKLCRKILETAPTA